MQRLRVGFVILMTLAAARPGLAQSLIGSVSGTVRDEQGGVLPGVTVTLLGKTGPASGTTDAKGFYRFPTVDPGHYEIRAELAGFESWRTGDVRVSIGTQLTLDAVLRVASVTETVEVLEQAPVVDVTSSATNTTLSQDLLFNLPLSRRAQDILNYAPGINDFSGYGGGDGSNALYLDGLDTRSPSTGSQYIYVDYNIIEEVQVGGLGAPAEYGGFTGAVVNTVTRSGGNRHSAIFDVQWTRSSLASDNITDEIAASNPSLTLPSITTKLLDVTAQVSGPIVKDKLFFLASAQRYQLDEDPPGPRTRLSEVTPRLNLKLTYQPGSGDHLTGTFQGEDYNRTGLSNSRYAGSLLTTDELSRNEDSQDRLLNLQWRHIFGSRTFGELKYQGWWAYDYLDPKVAEPIRYTFETGAYTGGGGYTAYFDRKRHEVKALVSHYADDFFGKHDFKFGVEFERSEVQDRLAYTGGLYLYDYYGPYLAYSYGYDQTGANHRESLFAQDSWRISDRVTVNAGLRYDWVRGISPALDDRKVFETRSLAPRVGVAWDVAGDHKTVLKAFYGRYYEGVFQTYYYRVLPGLEDLVTYDMTGGSPVEIDRVPRSEIIYRMDPDIQHPRVDEFQAAIERALTPDLRLVVTGIHRDNKNFIGSVNPSARWERRSVPNDLTGQPLEVYGWANPDESERDFVITNPDGFRFLDVDGNPIGNAEASRRYRAMMVVLNKRLSNRWHAQASYVLSKNEGTVDPFSVASVGYGRQFENPNLALVNADGEFEGSARHEFKLFASYEVPIADVNLSGYFRSISGYTYAGYERYSSSQIPGLTASGREPWLERPGSRRTDTRNLLDLRLEKVFKVGGGTDRVAVYADVFNVFNSALIDGVVKRVSGLDIEGVTVPFEGPTSVVSPRQVTFGARWSF